MTRVPAGSRARLLLTLRKPSALGKLPARWPRPGWSWTVTHEWTISAAFASATLLIGAGLAGIPVAVGGSWHDPEVRDQTWAFTALGVAGLVLLTAIMIVRGGRERMLRDNGTVYIVQEPSDGWASDQARDFLIAARRRFARTIVVPGPGRLTGPWDWPLDDGARHWDQKVTELTRSFKALHLDDDPQSPNGIFMWASWAVAVSFAARICAADRELVLDVWQRPSAGRASELKAISWGQGAHRFPAGRSPASTFQLAPECAPRQYTWAATVTTTARVRKENGLAEDPRVSVLLLRLGRQSWGPLRASGGPSGPHRVSLHLEDAAGLGLPARFRVHIHELRALPPAGQLHFPWQAFPSLVSSAAQWIQSTATRLDGHVLLLGSVVPPEVALGLGITAARAEWPATLWPIVYQVGGGALVIPRLELGSNALTRLGKA
jgi:hypothetical protein